jgi:hypothetical protein
MFADRALCGVVAAVAAASVAAGAARGGPPRTIDPADYEDRLHAMWLAQTVANWTGRLTEGARRFPPFFTDADWNTTVEVLPGAFRFLDFVTWQDPWWADDDTDLEYVYLHLMDLHGRNELTPAEIEAGWKVHVNRFIWVSNAEARMLMDRGVRPPSTGSTAANRWSLHIDAQLTTEFFGAIAPGMVAHALRIGDLPVRNTAASHAAHAAQLHIAMYAAAATADASLPIADRVMAVYEQGRAAIPDGSKAADIADYVLTDFLDNPDPTDWERTRDRVYERYQLRLADAYHGFPHPLDDLGFIHRGWTESSVNLATGLIALLYGAGDLRETIRIGTLTGWDSDNGTASVGALVGLMIGTRAVRDAFAPDTLSDGYDIARTRDALPADGGAIDTLAEMAARMTPRVREAVLDAGGRENTLTGALILPPPDASNPLTELTQRSANLSVRAAGGVVTATASHAPASGSDYGSNDPATIATGAELDFGGREPTSGNAVRASFSSLGHGQPPGAEQTLAVAWSEPRLVAAIHVVEGDHFPSGVLPASGGWFDAATLELEVAGAWVEAGAAGGGLSASEPWDAARPFQTVVLELGTPVEATGVRLRAVAGGADDFINLASLDALAPAAPAGVPMDLDGDGRVDVDDLYRFHAAPVDLDDDAGVDQHDRRYLQSFIRWNEQSDTTAGR